MHGPWWLSTRSWQRCLWCVLMLPSCPPLCCFHAVLEVMEGTSGEAINTRLRTCLQVQSLVQDSSSPLYPMRSCPRLHSNPYFFPEEAHYKQVNPLSPHFSPWTSSCFRNNSIEFLYNGSEAASIKLSVYLNGGGGG